MTTITTYIAEVDGQFANELHQLVTEGGADEKRAMFALNLASNSIDDTIALPDNFAAYMMNQYIGSTAIRGYDHFVHLLNVGGFISNETATFLKSDFILVDEVLCTCDVCDAR
jgi:hypothetical protein